MKLNRHNYEEYFILYMDNELTAEDRREVEAFAAANPDLKEELDMLLQTKFTPDTSITFDFKDSLLIRNSSAIDMNNYEEWLLCYIDNELTAEEIKDVERFVAAHPEAKKELELLQRAKLQPEAISFPNKESLYRKEEKAKVLPVRWWRAAAAVLLIAASAVSVYILNDKPAKQEGSVAKTTNGTKQTTPSVGSKTTNDAIQPDNTLPSVNVKDEVASTATDQQKEDKEPMIKKTIDQTDNSKQLASSNKELKAIKETKDKKDNTVQENAIASNETQKSNQNNLPTPTKENPYTVAPDEITQGRFAVNDKPKSLKEINTIPEHGAVTNPSPKPYNIQKSETEDESGLAFASNDEKKNKNRGFFRKIARTIEKRTNIKATDEDDRLLIAGLAIKLK